ncbi:synaptotagmin-like protein 2 isoform X3 [Pantherophis guttatus]|uniref:Synaptotagmin-like protein 2 isoform X3 n=1 Tax=Pantherophis guttatus TaxID=94885 RepID=A0ABM3Z1B6_PANGU|nr:synaptotagmin-like protein 2 isoform X3 [Pantherophis guttatus]
MIDLSFLTDEEQESILKVLQRDADLKKAEEERIRNLPEKVKDDAQVKNMSGQWFYEAKAKRHREKIHGADIIRASIRRKPLTIAELSHQSKSGNTKSSWVNNVNKEIFVSPEKLGVLQDKEEESRSNQSPKMSNAASNTLQKPQEETRKQALSPSKQRKNPFNDSTGPEDNAKTEQPENGMTDSSEATEEATRSPSVENQSRVHLLNYSGTEASEQPSSEFRQTGKLPIPKARKNVHKTSDVSLQSKDSLPRTPRKIKQVNGQGRLPKGILKRSSSSSSTDSEVLRLSQTLEPPNKSGLPTSTILEDVAEKSPPSAEDYSQNSLERLKQVRFSSSVNKNECPPKLELHEGKELGEFHLLDTNSVKANENEVNYLDGPSSPGKPARSYSPALDGNVKDGQESREGEMPSGSYSFNDSDLPRLVKSPPTEAALPGEPSRKIVPSTMDNETVPVVSQSKTKQLNPEPCDTTQHTTGQELRLAEAEEAVLPKSGLADPEQGKPALVVGRSVDKHAAESLKAADESISKVLDWFKRSSGTADKETVLITSQERPFAEETDTPKSAEWSAIGEDKGSNTNPLNSKSSLYQRGESTSRDLRLQDVIKQPGQLSFSENESPSDVVLGDQAPLNQSKENENATSRNIHGITKRTHFQTIDQSKDKMDESNPKDVCEDAFEDKTSMDLKNPDASFRTGMKREISSQTYTDGERDVKSFLEEENIELKSGETQKDPKGEACNFLDAKNMAHANNRSNLVLQQHELQQSSMIGDEKRVKDMKAFWEGGKMTPELGNKEVLTNENMSNYTKEYGRRKQVSGSSGYVTSESDHEQSKYNLVTFRKVELSEEDSEVEGDDVKFSGTSEPIRGDKSTESQDINIANEVLSNDQKNTNVTGLLKESSLQLSYKERASSKEGERPKVTALEKETILPALQPKSPFKIHSLKEKMDEESRSQMLNPSQFQSLRNFWDTGTKLQSKTDETISQQKHKGSTGSYTKELPERIGSSQAISDDGRSGFPLPEEETKKPTAKISHQSPLAVFSPSATTVPMPLDDVPIRDKDSSAPGKEHAGIKIISLEIQHKVAHSSFQPPALVEELQESPCPPIHEKGIPRVELVAKDPMAPNDQSQEPSFVLPDTNRKAGLKTSEVIEIVNKTLVPPKAAAADAFNTSLEKLLKETSGLQASLRHHLIMDVSEPADPTSEKRDFFNKVMDRSHHSYPSDPKEIQVDSQTEGTIEKRDSLRTQPVEFTTHMGSLPRSLEELTSVSMKVPNKEDRPMYLNDNPAWKKNLLVPSLELIQPDTCGAAQNRTDSPEEEVLEMVSKHNVPPNRECSNLNAKLISLLKESATWPSTDDILETPLDGIPKENQQKSYQQMSEKEGFASLQTSSHLRETVGEMVAGSKDTNKDDNVKIVPQDGTTEATREYADHKDRIQGELAGEQPLDEMETAVKTIKPKSCDQAAFRANLKQRLNEDSTVLLGGIEFPKFTQSTLQPDTAKDTLASQEVTESVEKSNIPSNSRQVEFKDRFQTLLKENSEILSDSQKIVQSSNEMQINKKSTENRGFISQQETDGVQEVNETANKISTPSRFQQSEFNSSLQKLLKEAAQALPSQHLNFPQEETIMKSVAPAKDDWALKSNLEKLILEHLDPASQPPTVDCKKVTGDSTPDLDEQRLPVRMSTLTETVSSDYRSELKIPLTEKASKQTDEGAKISENMAFQKIIHLHLASSKSPYLEEDKDFPSTTDKTEDRSIQEKETEFSTSLIDANRSLMVDHGLQRSSTPVYGSPLQTKEVELHHAVPPADDDNDDDGGAKNCSEEELNPVMKALKRNSNRQIPSKSVEDIPSATSNKEKINLAKEDLVLSAEDDHPAEPNDNPAGISTAPSFSDSQFSRPEKIKMMSKSVPAFLQDESDDRETDTASESSYLHGRLTKTPSSLTNLSSGSSGLASLSSVSTSVMSVYSGDFGNVDVKGNLQFAIDYVEQLKEFHIFIAQGKDLAVADVKRQRSDPYVKSYLLPEKHKLGKRKTSVKKKTLNPVYNEILRYKIDKAVLESQRLNISVWHHDTFGRNSFLGEVELDLANWDWNESQSKQMIWYPLKPRTPLKGLELENRGEIKIALQYIPQPVGGKKTPATGEVHIWVKQCNDLPVLRGPKLNSFVKCTVLPDTSRKSRQKTRAVAKTTNPVFNHTMVYDGFKPEDLKEACVELTVWDHNKLANHFVGGLRVGLGTGKSYGIPVDWMDSTLDEATLWERMINSPNTWVEDTLPLRMLMVAKMTK